MKKTCESEKKRLDKLRTIADTIPVVKKKNRETKENQVRPSYSIPNAERSGVRTPWGASQGQRHVAEGIDFFYTAGHGGYKISKARFNQMPEAFRKAIVFGNNVGWYEEDCDWSIVFLAFPTEFLNYYGQDAELFQKMNKSALRCLKQYHPEVYKLWMGVE